MSKEQIRQDAITRVLACHMLAQNRVMSLKPRVQIDGASKTEESILRRSERLIGNIENDFCTELNLIGLDALDCELSNVEPWPAADFWARISMKCMAYLASTSSADGGEEARYLLGQFQNDLRPVLGKIKLSEVGGYYLLDLTKN